MLSIIAAMGLLAAQTAAQVPLPAGWVQIDADQINRVSYDPASVRNVGGDRFSVRARADMNVPMADGAVLMLMLIEHLIDCGDGSMAYLSVSSHDARNMRLNSREVTMAEAVLEPVPADSTEAVLHGLVCRGR